VFAPLAGAEPDAPAGRLIVVVFGHGELLSVARS